MLLGNKVSQLETIHGKKNAQVMLITLLVLIVLGVIISAIVIVLRRDVEQTVSNEKYEELYNSAEGNLQSVANTYGDYTVSLSGLVTDFTECTENEANIRYTCTFVNTNFTSIESTTEVEIENSREIEEFEIDKDTSLTLDLNNYRDSVEISWDTAAAIELSLIYQDTNGEYQTIKDVFDQAGIFQSLSGDDPFTDPNGIHAFNYNVISGADPTQSFIVNLNSVSGISGADTLLALKLTPRMNQSFGSVRFDILATNPALFPYQMRVITSASFDANDGASPVVRLETQIPLAPQVDGVFDYSLLTDGDIGL